MTPGIASSCLAGGTWTPARSAPWSAYTPARSQHPALPRRSGMTMQFLSLPSAPGTQNARPACRPMRLTRSASCPRPACSHSCRSASAPSGSGGHRAGLPLAGGSTAIPGTADGSSHGSGSRPYATRMARTWPPSSQHSSAPSRGTGADDSMSRARPAATGWPRRISARGQSRRSHGLMTNRSSRSMIRTVKRGGPASGPRLASTIDAYRNSA
ncbi:MAG TPA: hypothetical protein VI365_13640 [Trebonia sp.]